MGGTNGTRVPKMCVRIRLHRKRAAARSRNSGSSEDEESGGDQEGRDSLQVVTLLGTWPVSPYSFTSHPPSFSFHPPSFIPLLSSPFFLHLLFSSFLLLSSSVLYSPPSFSFLLPSFIPLLPSPFFFRPLFPSFLLLSSSVLYSPPFFFRPLFPSLVSSSQHSSMSHVDVVRSSHRLPDSSSLDNERKLQRVATRGGTQFHSNLEYYVYVALQFGFSRYQWLRIQREPL